MFQEEEKARIKRQRTKEAIALAMESRWEEAAEANRNIIEIFPNDVDTFNRLGRALMEMGEYAQAREAYQSALGLDPNNSIAKKNLERLSLLKEEQLPPKRDQHKVAPHLFIEETSKAGVVSLVDVASREKLAKLAAGDQVQLKINGQRLEVEDSHGEYIGRVEPRHALRLVKLMKGGNKYVSAIASSNDTPKVIISEVYQHPSQAGHLPFPVKNVKDFRPYFRGKLLQRGEEEELSPEEDEYTSDVEEEMESFAEGFSLQGEEVAAQEEEEEQ